MNYFNYIAFELNNIISSYLDNNDILEFEKINNIDYTFLFKLRFPKLYTNNINIDIKELYLDILRASMKNKDFLYNTKSNNKKVGEINIDDERNLNISIFSLKKNNIRYLLINKKIPRKLEFIIFIDDVDLFIKNYEFIRNINFYIIIGFNSYNILTYIFENMKDKLTNENINIMKDVIKEAYMRVFIDIKTTKILFKYLNLNDDFLIDILVRYLDKGGSNLKNEEIETFVFILNNIRNVDNNMIISLLKRIYNSNDNINISYDKFKIIYDKYQDILSRDDIINLYRDFRTFMEDMYRSRIIKELTDDMSINMAKINRLSSTY